MSPYTTELLKLGFGKCSLQVQVPVNSGINDVEGLSGKRVVTSFEVLAADYFRGVDAKVREAKKAAGVNGEVNGEVEGGETKIEYVGGSVEAACALGLADGIGTYFPLSFLNVPTNKCISTVDLVESGDTMRAAGLHAIATVLTTEAVLIKSSTPKHPDLLPLIDLIVGRIKGTLAAAQYVLCEYNIRREVLAEAEVSFAILLLLF